VCAEGIHACDTGDLAYWLSEELWVIDLEEPVVRGEHKVAAARGRLVAQVQGWDEVTAGDFALACLSRVVGHAAAELQMAGLSVQAGRLAAVPADALAETARDVLTDLHGGPARRAGRLCGALVDVAEACGTYPAATIAYMSARAANQRSGPAEADYYTEERAWQAGRLTEMLKLNDVFELNAD